METFESLGLTVLYCPHNRPLYTNMVEGTQENFRTRNTRVNLLILAQDFEYSEGNSGSDDEAVADDNDDIDNDDDNNPHENNPEDNDDNEDDQEPPDNDQNGDDNPDSDDGSEPDNSDSDSSGAGDNGLPNGHVHEAAPTRDNNDDIEPEFILINGVYQNGYLSHPNPMVSSSTSDSSAYDSASEQGIQSSVSSETDPTTPESYHNPNSTRFFEENRAAIPQGDPYAPFTQARTQVNYAGGFRISATLVESFLTDSSESEEFVLPAIACSAATDVAPALLENLSLHDQSDAQPHVNMQRNVPMQLLNKNKYTWPKKRSHHGPFHRCCSYDQDPLFGYDGSTWSQKRRKIKALNLLSKGGFTLPANTSSHAVAKCFSDVSNAAHLGFLGSSSHPFGGTSTGCTSTRFMGFSGSKRKVEEASTTSSRKILKLSADGVASKAFRNGTSDSSAHLSSAIFHNFGKAPGPSQLLKVL